MTVDSKQSVIDSINLLKFWRLNDNFIRWPKEYLSIGIIMIKSQNILIKFYKSTKVQAQFDPHCHTDACMQ